MITGPAVAVADLVPQQQAGVPATFAHDRIIDHVDDAALGTRERTRQYYWVIEIAYCAQFFEGVHHLDSEITLIMAIILDRRQDHDLLRLGRLDVFWVDYACIGLDRDRRDVLRKRWP